MRVNSITRKGKRFFAPALAFLTILGCGGDSGMPCIRCIDEEPEPYKEYGCFAYDDYYGNYRCFYTTIDECRNYYGGDVVNSCPDYPPEPEVACWNYNGSCSYRTESECYGHSGIVANSCSGESPWQGGDNSSPSNGSSSSANPDTYQSSSSMSSPSVNYTDKGNSISSYETKTIGSQVWMAENLNYNVTGSKCYDEGSSSYSAEVQSNCDKYGRLYDWATAMALPSSCNSSTCSGQVNTKHRGICPSGWHIPSEADWDALMTAVGGSSTAGRYLKATSGWSNCGPSSSGNSYLCEDTYSFSALPGGYGHSGGNFDFVGNSGYWWSSSESSSDV